MDTNQFKNSLLLALCNHTLRNANANRFLASVQSEWDKCTQSAFKALPTPVTVDIKLATTLRKQIAVPMASDQRYGYVTGEGLVISFKPFTITGSVYHLGYKFRYLLKNNKLKICGVERNGHYTEIMS